MAKGKKDQMINDMYNMIAELRQEIDELKGKKSSNVVVIGDSDTSTNNRWKDFQTFREAKLDMAKAKIDADIEKKKDMECRMRSYAKEFIRAHKSLFTSDELNVALYMTESGRYEDVQSMMEEINDKIALEKVNHDLSEYMFDELRSVYQGFNPIKEATKSDPIKVGEGSTADAIGLSGILKMLHQHIR